MVITGRSIRGAVPTRIEWFVTSYAIMQDPSDKKTISLKLPAASGARQASYAARQRAAGLVQVNLWMTPAEKQAVLSLLSSLRGDQVAKETS